LTVIGPSMPRKQDFGDLARVAIYPFGGPPGAGNTPGRSGTRRLMAGLHSGWQKI